MIRCDDAVREADSRLVVVLAREDLLVVVLVLEASGQEAVFAREERLVPELVGVEVIARKEEGVGSARVVVLEVHWAVEEANCTGPRHRDHSPQNLQSNMKSPGHLG